MIQIGTGVCTNNSISSEGWPGSRSQRHPLLFLREELRARRIVSCAEAMAARDGRWLEAVGLVLVRQRPGSAKGVMLITLEDEADMANLVVWLKVFVGERDASLPLPHGRGDEFHHGSPGLDPHGLPKGPKRRNIVDPFRHIDQIKMKTRDFR